MPVHLKGVHRGVIATAASAHARDITEHDARRIAATAGEMMAAYCGVSLSTFTAWVQRGTVPGQVSRTHRWEKAIDIALDALNCINDKREHNALDQWKAKHRAH
jgi:hypothetical protein